MDIFANKIDTEITAEVVREVASRLTTDLMNNKLKEIVIKIKKSLDRDPRTTQIILDYLHSDMIGYLESQGFKVSDNSHRNETEIIVSWEKH